MQMPTKYSVGYSESRPVELSNLRGRFWPWADVSRRGASGRLINAKCETVDRLPMKDAYRRRRCILPVDGFFEWRAIKGQKAKQPYAIAMKSGEPLGIGGLWENWNNPKSGE